MVTLRITRIKEGKTKVVHSKNFAIHYTTFFKQTSVFPRFLVKSSCEKTGINFQVSSCSFSRTSKDKKLIYPKVEAVRILIKQISS